MRIQSINEYTVKRSGKYIRFGLRIATLLVFLTFSVLVKNYFIYTVANPARGLLNREKRTKEKACQRTPGPPPPTLLIRRKINKNKNHATHLQALRRGLGRSRVHTMISSARRLGTRPMGVNFIHSRSHAFRYASQCKNPDYLSRGDSVAQRMVWPF